MPNNISDDLLISFTFYKSANNFTGKRILALVISVKGKKTLIENASSSIDWLHKSWLLSITNLKKLLSSFFSLLSIVISFFSD